VSNLALNHLGNLLLERHGGEHACYPTINIALAIILATGNQSADRQGA
jgi:hypothetical protein